MMPRPYRPAGFTLIEILVVVVLIAIVMGVVVNAFTGADREQTLRGYSERLALRIEMARDKALQANREWGVYIDREGVRFAEFDEINGEWVQRGERPFAAENYDTEVDFEVEVEEYEGSLGDAEDVDEEQEVPTIVLFSSGETTPFEILIQPKDWETLPWRLDSDGFTRTSVTRSEQG